VKEVERMSARRSKNYRICAALIVQSLYQMGETIPPVADGQAAGEAAVARR
jgi:hypothetical protein